MQHGGKREKRKCSGIHRIFRCYFKIIIITWDESLGNEREIQLEEMKQIELHILGILDEYCTDRGLRYCLTYGTLIGAMRHKGFIPWDDDIDVIMPRSDYEKLLSGFSVR